MIAAPAQARVKSIPAKNPEDEGSLCTSAFQFDHDSLSHTLTRHPDGWEWEASFYGQVFARGVEPKETRAIAMAQAALRQRWEHEMKDLPPRDPFDE